MKKQDTIQHLILFCFIILSFHYIYLFWSFNGFKPVRPAIDKLFNYTGKMLFNQSDALIHMIKIDHTEVNSTFYFKTTGKRKHGIFANNGYSYLEVSPQCTSLKQWMHWIILMMVFPGPIKNKIWFIPAGVIVLHFINVFRITGLSIVLSSSPHSFHFFHDYFFKILFYAGIFIMWVLWREKFLRPEMQYNQVTHMVSKR